jgi:hypothetical protein
MPTQAPAKKVAAVSHQPDPIAANRCAGREEKAEGEKERLPLAAPPRDEQILEALLRAYAGSTLHGTARRCRQAATTHDNMNG